RLSSVVLPEPLGPMKATNSPFSTSRFSPCRTWISSPPRWYLLSSPRTLIRLEPFLTPSTRTMLLPPPTVSLLLPGRRAGSRRRPRPICPRARCPPSLRHRRHALRPGLPPCAQVCVD